MRKRGVTDEQIAAAERSDDPSKAMRALAESGFQARHANITKTAMTIPGGEFA